MSHYVINAWDKKSHINKEIYGHFSEHLGRCIYNGIFVGDDPSIPNINGMRCDVVNALRKIKLPVLRWPGGCFADTYHWKDGVGPLEQRKKMVNTHWGGVVEDNSFGTHEFMELCRQIGCEPYISVNVGSGTIQEAQEWVEYMNFDGLSPMTDLRRANGQEAPWQLKYIGIGNENWGCGGNMRPEYYADVYRQYQTYIRSYGETPVYKIACGPADYNWTHVMMKNAARYMNGLSLHYYTTPGDGHGHKGSATDFDAGTYYRTLYRTMDMQTRIEQNSKIMDLYDPEKKVALVIDEWGTWFDVEPGTNPGFLYQQNTMRDAMVAGINLNIFNQHSDRVRMANIAQIVNVLQSVILTEGNKMLLTPTYHVFDLYKCHQDATLLASFIETTYVGCEDYRVPDLYESASMDADGNINITLCNLSLSETREIDTVVLGKEFTCVAGEILHDRMDARNTFESPEAVAPRPFTEFSRTEEKLLLKITPCSVTHIVLK